MFVVRSPIAFVHSFSVPPKVGQHLENLRNRAGRRERCKSKAFWKRSGAVWFCERLFFVHFRAVLRISLRRSRILAADSSADISSQQPASNVVYVFSSLFVCCCERRNRDARNETPFGLSAAEFELKNSAFCVATPRCNITGCKFWREHPQMPSVSQQPMWLDQPSSLRFCYATHSIRYFLRSLILYSLLRFDFLRLPGGDTKGVLCGAHFLWALQSTRFSWLPRVDWRRRPEIGGRNSLSMPSSAWKDGVAQNVVADQGRRSCPGVFSSPHPERLR